MVITDEIEDAIAEFRASHGGQEPTRVRLGKLQVAALKAFAERYSLASSAFGNPSYESKEGERLPIEESPNADELTLE